jgi:hypothetical protein
LGEHEARTQQPGLGELAQPCRIGHIGLATGNLLDVPGVDEQQLELILEHMRGIRPIIARRKTKHGSELGRLRWVVERTSAWLHQIRRLRIRWERDPRLYLAFMSLGYALICWRYLQGVMRQALSEKS